MVFPLIKKSKVVYHTMLMALSIETDFGGQVYGRKYYSVIYEDHSELIFLTTNEPDSECNEQPLDEEFSLVMNFKEMLDDFEKSALNGLAFDAGFNSLPKYIYYNIITIDDSIKPFILEHLKDRMIGYSDIDYNDHEKKQLNVWLEYLSE